MGICHSNTHIRQGAVHPEQDLRNNNRAQEAEEANLTITTTTRPPPHNNTAATATGATNRRRKQPAATPLRRQKVSRIEYTPIVKAEKDRFKFSCPLCFCYFAKTILSTSCCSNYTCYTCALEHSKNHGLPRKAKQLPERLQNVPCPHCNTANVQLKYVAPEDAVRSYDTSPATKLRLLEGSLEDSLRIDDEVPEQDSSSEEEGLSPVRSVEESVRMDSAALVVA